MPAHSMALLSHTLPMLAARPAWSWEEKTQMSGSWWRPQHSPSGFPETGLVMEEGPDCWRWRQTLSMWSRSQDSPLLQILTAEPSLSNMLSFLSNSIWRPSPAPKPQVSRGIKRGGCFFLPEPGSTCACHKHLWHEIRDFTMIVSQTDITGLHGAPSPLSVSWRTIPGASTTENWLEAHTDFGCEYSLQISSGVTSWPLLWEPL